MGKINSTITKFIISRRCNLPLQEITTLRDEQLFAYFEKFKSTEKVKTDLANLLINLLYQSIPLIHESHRSSLVQLKRDIYNDRGLASIPVEVLNLYNLEGVITNLTILKKVNEEISNLKETINFLWQEYFIKARAIISEICDKHDFKKSIQLSGQRLINIVKDYQHAVSNNTKNNKKLKQTEDTLISYYYRMILKPSPFASFNTIRAHVLPEYYQQKKNNIYRCCSVSRNVIQWLASQCLTHERLINHLPLRLNSTLIIADQEIVFFVRSDEGSKSIYSGEKFIKITSSDVVKKIIGILKNKECSKDELITEISSDPNLNGKIASYIEDLIRIGLLERRFLIPDLTQRYAREVGKILRQYDDSILQLISECFFKIHDIETVFETAAITHRKKLLLELRAYFEKILHYLNHEKPEFDHVRTYIYEDVGEICGDLDSKQNDFAQYQKDFYDLAKVLPVHDDAVIERISIYNFFISLYPNQAVVSLLDFYRAFAKLDVEALTKIMSGNYSSEVKEIKKLRNLWNKMLDLNINNDPMHEVIQIDKHWLKDFISEIPDYLHDSNSIILYLQKCGNIADSPLMFNGVSMGYGALYSRFCSIFGEDSDLINKALIDALNKDFKVKDFFDLVAVLGVNTNLHPALFENFVEYPGCVTGKMPSTSKVCKLNEIYVKVNPARRRLELINKNTDEEINLRPLNFLFPGIGPNLYRFIYLFSPYLNYKGGIWRKYPHMSDDERICVLPQIKLGNLILDRKTWKFPIKFLPKFLPLQENILSLLSQLSEWRNEWHIPEQVFYRQSEKRIGAENWILAMREYISFANKAKLRKPHFLDFKNPLLLRIFLKHITANPENNLIVQECMPSVNMSQEAANNFVEEVLLQFNY